MAVTGSRGVFPSAYLRVYTAKEDDSSTLSCYGASMHQAFHGAETVRRAEWEIARAILRRRVQTRFGFFSVLRSDVAALRP